MRRDPEGTVNDVRDSGLEGSFRVEGLRRSEFECSGA